jgi:hypothetical protein
MIDSCFKSISLSNSFIFIVYIVTVLSFFHFSPSHCSHAFNLPHTDSVQAFLRRWQNRADCANTLWVESHCQNSGIGSEIHVATAALAFAINHDAIMIWSDTAWLRQAVPPCSTFDCVFLPISNCTRADLEPHNQLPIRLETIGDQVPRVFANFSTDPFPLKYWWRAQGANYLTRFRHSFREQLDHMRELYFPVPAEMPCNCVCVFVRHGAKALEMTLLPFRSFLAPIQTAFELLRNMVPPAVRSRSQSCAKQAHPTRSIFLMTDDAAVIAEAPSMLDGIQLMHVDDVLPSILPHEIEPAERAARIANEKLMHTSQTSDAAPRGTKLSLWTRFWGEMSRWYRKGKGNSNQQEKNTMILTGTIDPVRTAETVTASGRLNRYGIDVTKNMTHNFYMSFLQLHLCLQCDGFVGQRQTNFFRLIDELRMTRARKLWAPVVEAGVYSFDWK